jgi:hypothetical protein
MSRIFTWPQFWAVRALADECPPWAIRSRSRTVTRVGRDNFTDDALVDPPPPPAGVFWVTKMFDGLMSRWTRPTS